MKNIKFTLLLSITMIFLSSAYAEPYHSDPHHSGHHHSGSDHSGHHHADPYHSKHRSKAYRSEDYDKSFIPLDLLVFRPLGLLTTIAGTGVFIGVSPFTALASIADHDAFHKTANIFIAAPASYTFSRPLGDTSLFKFPDP